MFIPSVHAETSIPVLRDVIRQNPLGVLTTAIPSQDHPFILSSHIPFVLDVDDESSETELGRLRGHLARQNPQSKAMVGSLDANITDVGTLEQEVLVLFTSAPHHYVTPKFYRETKPTTGKVVPTWNYTAVQAYGSATIFFGSSSKAAGDFLGQQIHDLSQHAETTVMDYTGQGDRPGPWKVTDAPDRYIELMKKNIIGIEISITRLEGKFKMSQEMRKGDREGVIAGFGRMGTAIGDAIAATVQQRSDLKEGAKN
jgi:transcriptional regulator